METETTDRRVWATVLYDRRCLPGVLVLDYTLREQGSKYPLIVIMTKKTGKKAAKYADIAEVLSAAGITVELVDKIVAEREGDRYFNGDWQKLAAWSLTSYERIVLLDSNQLIFQPIDDLQTLDFSHYPPGHGEKHIATSLAIPGFPYASTVILQPSLTQYNCLQNTLNNFVNRRIRDEDILGIAYLNRMASLPPVYSARESKRGTYDSTQVRVRLYDFGRPWQKRKGGAWAKREGRPLAGEWFEAWRDVRGEWVRDGVSGVDVDERRRLWERVLVPMVGDEP